MRDRVLAKGIEASRVEMINVWADPTEVHDVPREQNAYRREWNIGDRFVLDGRCLEFRRREGHVIHVQAAGMVDGGLPIWHSDRQSLTADLSADLAEFRSSASRLLREHGSHAMRAWLIENQELQPMVAAVLVELFEAQERFSEVPSPSELLIEESPGVDGEGRDLRRREMAAGLIRVGIHLIDGDMDHLRGLERARLEPPFFASEQGFQPASQASLIHGR